MMSGYWWAGVFGMVLVVLVALSAWTIVGSTPLDAERSKQGAQQHESAEVVLAERLARGEIDIDEYHRRLEALKGT
jgi:putative membrane protein